MDGYNVLTGVESRTSVFKSLTISFGDIFGNGLSTAMTVALAAEYLDLRPSYATTSATVGTVKVFLMS